MSIFSNGTFTPPGKIIISNSRANPTERISHLHNHAIPIHFHHHKSKNCFHNVNTVVCVHSSFPKGGCSLNSLKFIVGDSDNIDRVLANIQDYIQSFKNARFILSCSFDEHSDNEQKKDSELLRQEAITQLEAFANSIHEGITNGKTKLFTHEQITQFMIAYYRDKPAKILEDFPDEHCEELRNTIIAGIKELEENDSHEARSAINATAHKAKALMLERSNVGRKLSDKNALSTLYEANGIVHTGQKGKKEITAVVSLNFSELEEWKSHVPAFRRLKPFDMDILAHAVTLYQAGNQVISTDMLFRQMNGGKHKETTQAMRNEIYDSFARLAQTWISINAQEEFNAGYNTQPVFKGALLPCSMIIGGNITINGQPAHDCIKLYDKSPLIEYAKAKGQISNIPLAMFDIPKVNRTTDNIALIGYLIRAYADMTHPHSKIKHIISYQPIYDYLGVEGDTPGIIATKTKRIRTTVKQILTAWRDMGFIKGFHELTEDNKPARQGAKVSKVKIEFFTDKKLKSGHDSENNSANK